MNLIAIMHTEYVEWACYPYSIELDLLNSISGGYNNKDKALFFVDSIPGIKKRYYSTDMMDRTNKLFSLAEMINGSVFFFQKGCWNRIRNGKVTFGDVTFDV